MRAASTAHCRFSERRRHSRRWRAARVLRIIATDPGSVKDFEAFSRQTGNELLESHEDGGKFYYRLKKV